MTPIRGPLPNQWNEYLVHFNENQLKENRVNEAAVITALENNIWLYLTKYQLVLGHISNI